MSLAIFFCFVIGPGAQTQSLQYSSPLSYATPTSSGVSEERIAKIDQLLENAVNEDQIPAVAALIVKDGKIIYQQAYGIADVETGKPLTEDAIFRIASQSKAITSTAVMMLWEEGKFRLDDPISRFIPEFKDAQVLDSVYADGTYSTIPADKPITIRHLLTHTSGLGYGVIDGDPRMRKIYADAGIVDLFTTKPVTIAENIKKLASLPLHHHPGERFTYSEGLDVLGYFIEIVSGKPFDVYLRDHLFGPLGMEDTGFYLPDYKAHRMVTVHQRKDDQWSRFPVTFYDPDYPIKGAKSFFSGGAGLSSTLKDYAIFLQMYLNGGEYNGIRILSRTTIETMMKNQVGDLFWFDSKYYGLSFGVITDQGVAQGGIGSKGTFDWGGYFNTSYFADPEEKIIGLIFKQTSGPLNDPTSWKFRQMVMASIDD
ncbi:MAG: beta-lactamase family protein [Saprospiraceae bacterium]|nr:beta-lactamase family protein [Saprospiraceae bacterium]